MKKIYKSPIMNVLNIEVQQIITASEFTKNGEGDVTSGKLYDENATGTGLSRRNSAWDEKDEDFDF